MRTWSFLPLVSALLASCSSTQPLDPAFISNRSAKVAVVTMEAPTAQVTQVGGQGLLDIAINQAIASGRNKRLSDYPSQARLNAVGERFATRLKSLGYDATLLDFHPSRKKFVPLFAKPSAKKPVPGHDTHLRGYDAALFLDMPSVGQMQMVYGFVPLSGRMPQATLTGAMFSPVDHRLLWRPSMNNATPTEKESGSNSDMDHVFRQIDRIIDSQAAALEADFFKGY